MVDNAYAQCYPYIFGSALLTYKISANSLHNIDDHPITAPLIIYLPPSPVNNTPEDEPASIPGFLDKHPVVVINYRWTSLDVSFAQTSPPVPVDTAGGSDTFLEGTGEDENEVKSETFADMFPVSSSWPTPVHDVGFGYQWILANLSPPGYRRRDIYVYGTHLGASLGCSLALTESYPHRRVAIRGVAAYNGVYNWTMFLPGHPIYKPTPSRSKVPRPFRHRIPPKGTWLYYLWSKLPSLFSSPADLFDPFASPSLLFHNPGMLVPVDFDKDIPIASNLIHPAIMEKLAEGHPATEGVPGSPAPSLLYNIFKRPRKSQLTYPPKHSAVRIPDTLLLHDSPPEPPPTSAVRRSTAAPITFELIDVFLEQQHRWYAARKKRLSPRIIHRLPVAIPAQTAKAKTKAARAALQRLLDNTYEGHARELAIQMRNSIANHEFKDRMRDAQAWELEEAATREEPEVRVRIVDVGLGVEMAAIGEDGVDYTANIPNNEASRWLHVPEKVESAVSLWLGEKIDAAKMERKREMYRYGF